MTVHDPKDKEGRIFAFEVSNSNLPRQTVCKVVRSIPGVRIVRAPKFLSWFREDVFLEFELHGQKFEAWEPFGDSSRYWIGPQSPQWCNEVEAIRNAFLKLAP